MATYPELPLVSDGFNRVALYRDPGTRPGDAVIWLHGGNGIASEFLRGIRQRNTIIDIAPQGLVTGKNTGWTNPWEDRDDVPKGAPDNLIDLRFVAALETLVRKTFRSIRRVWLCGFSAGGGLVWSCWAKQSEIPHTFSGLCVAGKKLRKTPANSWNWNAKWVTPLPFTLIHGALDDADDAPDASPDHFSWPESYAQARIVNGNTTNVPAVARHAFCCDPDKLVRLRIAGGGDAPTAHYVVENVGHVWQHCDACHTDDFVIERFTASGLGS